MIIIEKATGFTCTCDGCGRQKKIVATVKIGDVWQTIKTFDLCKDCKAELGGQVGALDYSDAPHGGKWFQIWKDDREGVMASMYRNLNSDLENGYDPLGRCIQQQLEDINNFRKAYNEALDSFVNMSDQEVSRWCYYTLKKIGAIE